MSSVDIVASFSLSSVYDLLITLAIARVFAQASCHQVICGVLARQPYLQGYCVNRPVNSHAFTLYVHTRAQQNVKPMVQNHSTPQRHSYHSPLREQQLEQARDQVSKTILFGTSGQVKPLLVSLI